MVPGVPNAFSQTNMPPNKDVEEMLIIINNRGASENASGTGYRYRKHFVFENGNKVIYVVVLK